LLLLDKNLNNNHQFFLGILEKYFHGI